uniref:Titin n=1 Tax=Laticauda laticaudata TaxID=8630 RepID=A0A8C5SPU6_LATLA
MLTRQKSLLLGIGLINTKKKEQKTGRNSRQSLFQNVLLQLDVKLIEGLVVKAGSTVRFPAIMRGVPIPTAKWVTDNTEIKSEGNYKIDTDNYSTVLTIKSCTRKDTGEYLLTVSNLAGSKTVAVHLTVLDVPGPPTGPIDIVEVAADHMVIAWRPPKDDGGSPVINYIVEKRESKKETWGMVCSSLSQTRLKIPRLQKGAEYIFRVRAENKIGIGPPLDSQPTVAKPEPDITWSKDGKILTKDKRADIIQEVPRIELQIKSSTRADHGKYIISAKNSSGHAQASAIVNVLDRPGPCRNLKVSYVTKD